MKNYKIELSYLPYDKDGLPSFDIFRRARTASELKTEADIFGYSLPVRNGELERAPYWVTFEPKEGFEVYRCSPHDNNYLTLNALFYALCAAAKSALTPENYSLSNSFSSELFFNHSRHSEGIEQLVVEPYRLRSAESFGWLLNYHFRLEPNVPFSRRVQQLSLSLDKNFKRNLNCYIDRRSKITEFLMERFDLLEGIELRNQDFSPKLSRRFQTLHAKLLNTKIYHFKDERGSRGQYAGIKEHGPLVALESPPTLVFIFEEKYRTSARKLAMALKGSKDLVGSTYPGFKELFKTDIDIDSSPIILSGSNISSYAEGLREFKEKSKPGITFIPILVIPDSEDNGYLEHKSLFTNAGIPTQVCTLKVIEDRTALKWSIANLALQIFCKCGGKPWKVKPTIDDTLIIGISQSHKLVETPSKSGSIEKYFAFSVMTDNSGLFQEITVLSESESKAHYIERLKATLVSVLTEVSKKYRRVVIHTSFRLKKSEIKAIQEVVQKISADIQGEECTFAVVKINPKNRFFGFNQESNSLVPYEGTYTKLGGREYLLWFEGVFLDQQMVKKAYPGPTHLTILDIYSKESIQDEVLLQDLLNLSGANWRGFNAKSAPVSTFYCHLIAELVRNFQSQNLPLPAVKDLKPWFL